jgi:hypothetical protein
MTKKLSEKDWIPFKIEELFDANKGIYLNKKNIIDGKNPYVTASSTNNGITDFIGNPTLFSGNSITIEKVKLSSFYQPKEFYCSHDVSVLSHQKFNKPNAIFIAHMVNRQGEKYSYGRQAQLNVVKRETVFLPVTNDEHPDWSFMETYSQSLIEKKKTEYIEFCQKELKKLKYKEINNIREKQWKEFFLTEIFPVVQRGKRLTKANQLKGETPYVSSTASNNGVDNFIGNENKVRIFSNCISIANSGSVGSSFYHPYQFIGSDHITHLKNDSFNSFIYQFIATQTGRLSQKYNFNREINDKRISREKILLPVKNNGQPDYAYMAQYMMNLEHKKRKQYLDYLGINVEAEMKNSTL